MGRLILATYPDAHHMPADARLSAEAEFRDLGFMVVDGRITLILFGRDAQGRGLEATKALDMQTAERLQRELREAMAALGAGPPPPPRQGEDADPDDLFAARRTARDGE